MAARNKLEAGKADLIQGEKELEAAKLAIEEGRARLEAEWKT